MGFILFHDKSDQGKIVPVLIDPTEVRRIRGSFADPNKCEVDTGSTTPTWVAMPAVDFAWAIMPYVNVLEHEDCNEFNDFTVAMKPHKHIGLNDPCREQLAREAYTREQAHGQDETGSQGCQGPNGHSHNGHSSTGGCCHSTDDKEAEALPVHAGATAEANHPPGSVQP